MTLDSVELADISSRQSTASITNDQNAAHSDDFSSDDDVDSTKENPIDSNVSEMESKDRGSTYTNEPLVKLVRLSADSNRKSRESVDERSSQGTIHDSPDNVESYEDVDVDDNDVKRTSLHDRGTSKDITRDRTHSNDALVKLASVVSDRCSKELVDVRSSRGTIHGSTENVKSYEDGKNENRINLQNTSMRKDTTSDDTYSNEVLVKLVNAVSNRKGVDVRSRQGKYHGSTENVESYEDVDIDGEGVSRIGLQGKTMSEDATRDSTYSNNALVKLVSLASSRKSKEFVDIRTSRGTIHDSTENVESYEDVNVDGKDDSRDRAYSNDALAKLMSAVSNRKNNDIVDIRSSQGTFHDSTENVDSYEDVVVDGDDVNLLNVQSTSVSEDDNRDSTYSNDALVKLVHAVSNRKSNEFVDERFKRGTVHNSTENIESYEDINVAGTADNEDSKSADVSGRCSGIPSKTSGENDVRSSQATANGDINYAEPYADFGNSSAKDGIKRTIRKLGVRSTGSTLHDCTYYDETYEDVKDNSTNAKSRRFCLVPPKGAKPAIRGMRSNQGTTRSKSAFYDSSYEDVVTSNDSSSKPLLGAKVKNEERNKGWVDNTVYDKSNPSVKYAKVDKDRKKKRQSQGWIDNSIYEDN